MAVHTEGQTKYLSFCIFADVLEATLGSWEIGEDAVCSGKEIRRPKWFLLNLHNPHPSPSSSYLKHIKRFSMFIFHLFFFFISLLVCNIYLVLWWVWTLSLLIDWLVNCYTKLRKINKLINKSLPWGCTFWSFNSLGLGWVNLCKICTFEGTKWKSIT